MHRHDFYVSMCVYDFMSLILNFPILELYELELVL
jgi:hypothetical protein